jgi:hypothetical protein
MQHTTVHSTGQKPNPDDLPFRHYSLQHRVTAWISHTLFDWS